MKDNKGHVSVLSNLHLYLSSVCLQALSIPIPTYLSKKKYPYNKCLQKYVELTLHASLSSLVHEKRKKENN
jgi:hypothetical protein